MPDTPIPPDAQPTPAAQWQTAVERGFLTQLPSGNWARVTRSDFFLTMIKENRLPNPLAQVVSDMIKNKGQIDQDASLEEMATDSIPSLLGFMDEVAMAVMLEPRVEQRPTPQLTGDVEHDAQEQARCKAWSPSEGVIELTALTFEDRAFLFRVALGGATDLESFRAEQAALVAASQHGPSVPRPAKRTSRAKKATSKR